VQKVITQWPKEEGQTTQWPKEGQTTQWPQKDKRTKNDLQNITQKTKD
jgi:hypothetical protein